MTRPARQYGSRRMSGVQTRTRLQMLLIQCADPASLNVESLARSHGVKPEQVALAVENEIARRAG